MQHQTVMSVYKKISKRIEVLKGREPEIYTSNQMILELNWIRAELEQTREINPEK